MGSWRLSQPGVVARLLTAALGSGILLAGSPAPVAAHGMTPAVDSYSQFDSYVDQVPMPPFACQKPAAAVPCYGPPQLRNAYDVQPLLDGGVTGAGTTIVIIDAFQDPVLSMDISLFDQIWSLPAADLATPIWPDGKPAFDGSALQKGWAREIAIDVEWAHVIAPGARLQLVLAKSEQDVDLLSATRYAIENNLGDVISQSFGEAESCPSAQFLADQHAVFQTAVDQGMTLIASSGDSGPAEHTCDGTLVAGVSTPASDPLVTAVGGTHLVADRTTGAYVSEAGWDNRFGRGASGGGFSAVFARPGYQAPFIKDNSARGLPDVAWSADVYGATIAVALGGLGATFGTSAGTAEWAGVAALGVQAAGHRLGVLNIPTYHAAKGHAAVGSLHDITSGNNSFGGFTGFSADDGWDAVTGVGTPDVSRLVAWFAIAG